MSAPVGPSMPTLPEHGRSTRAQPRTVRRTADLAAEAPEWMTDGQRECWTHAMAHAPAGLLKSIDRAMLAVWVEAEDRHRTAMIQQARLDAGSSLPLLTKGRDGQPIASPYLRIICQAAETMLRAAAELGFSPAARPRLAPGQAAQRPEDEPWMRLRVLQGGRDAAG
ncbi:hypothetical protein E2C06_29635 [Dankookia rubra]|uniref:Phage terminase small subunit P27 family n=2 Tax=Dankookia rubra TaxID=1442381 RepID=A0A4R5Q941_9PROT|nr:hypothetical protein E2C06_29635 [Dankookia rubra]